MIGVWRASDQAVGDRLDYMRHAIEESIAPFDLRPEDPRRFDCEIRAARVGALTIVDIQAPPSEAIRSPRLIARSNPELCTVHFQLSGSPVVEQDGRQSRLASGDVALVDLSRPIRVVSPAQRQHQASVVLPRDLLPFGRGRTDRLTGKALPARAASWSLLVGLIRQLVKDLDGYDEGELVRIGSAFVELMAAALSTMPDQLPPETHRRALLLRIHAFIAERIGDADLSPNLIAAAHHISVRYLHVLFESQEATVASTIRRRRLEQCRRDLADPDLAGVPVSAIGARSGFRDPSLFNRVFRREHGLTPGEFRRMSV